MKYTTFQLLTFATAAAFVLGLSYVGVPIWGILLSLPVFGYLQLYWANQLSFRGSLRLEPIPEKGYDRRIAYLDTNQLQLEGLGFTKIDEFYMKTSSDIVAYIYKLEGLPITLVDYDMQVAKFMDIETRFDNGFSITTTSVHNFGIVLPPSDRFTQVFPGFEPARLLDAHLQSLEFLKRQGFAYSQLQSEIFREYFLNEFLAQGKWIRSPFAPVVMFYRMAFKKGLKYRQPIRDQVHHGVIALPD